jgi:MFS family permease
LTTAWPQVLAIRALDRTGKGIRSAPRDVMLSRFATAANRGRIFGFHQSMDHVGAIVGPVAATIFLYFLPDRYRLLFALTAIPGGIAVAMLFRVREDATAGPLLSGGGTTRQPLRETLPSQTASLPGRLYALLAVILLFSLGNSADAFLLLRLSTALGGATYVPLLWAALHVVKASLSTWGGGLSDRVGRKHVIIAGWIVYAAVYLGFATASSTMAFVAWFLTYGVYFALTEGAEKAMVADLTPAGHQGRAFGLYNGALGGGALIASVVFGFIYDRLGAPTAFTVGSVLAAAAAVALLFVPSANIEGSHAPNPRHQ